MQQFGALSALKGHPVQRILKEPVKVLPMLCYMTTEN
jgi:hypothetical protein